MHISFFRLIIGIFILAIVVAVWTPFVVNHTTTLAVVNAEMQRYSAPFHGMASDGIPNTGDIFPAGNPILVLSSTNTDQRELERLRLEQSISRTRTKRILESLQTLERHEEDILYRWSVVAESAREVLQNMREEAKAQHKAAIARASQAEVDLAFAEDMNRRGLYAETRVAAARSALSAFRAEADLAEARMGTIDARLRALERGVHMSDGYNDVPYSVQQLDRILLLREQMLDRLAEEKIRESGLEASIAKELLYLEKNERFSIQLEKPMLVWARHVAPGSAVPAGTAVLDLIDCDKVFVEALLPDRIYQSIIGSPATIRLSGGTIIDGVVASLKGAGTREPGLLTAATPEADATRRLIARIDLSKDSIETLKNTQGGTCSIGRLVEVSIFRERIAENVYALLGEYASKIEMLVVTKVEKINDWFSSR